MNRGIDTEGVRHIASPARDHLGDADVLLTRAEAAVYLRCSVPTMERWAANGDGPPYRMVGRRALYSLTGLRRFAGIEAA